jgi:hypothetical protein
MSTSTIDDVIGGGDIVLRHRPPEAPLRGKLEVKAIELNGKPDDALTRFVTMRLRALQGCYEIELKRNATHKGTVTLQGTITTEGRNNELTIADDIGSDMLDSCLRAIPRGWVYPFKPAAPAKLKLVFTLKPRD